MDTTTTTTGADASATIENIYLQEIYLSTLTHACAQLESESAKIKKDKRKGHNIYAYWSTAGNGETPHFRIGSVPTRRREDKYQVIDDAWSSLSEAADQFADYLRMASPYQLYLVGFHSSKEGQRYGGFSSNWDGKLSGKLLRAIV